MYESVGLSRRSLHQMLFSSAKEEITPAAKAEAEHEMSVKNDMAQPVEPMIEPLSPPALSMQFAEKVKTDLRQSPRPPPLASKVELGSR